MPNSTPVPLNPPLQQGFGCMTSIFTLLAILLGGALEKTLFQSAGRTFCVSVCLMLFIAIWRRNSAVPLERAALHIAMIPMAIPLALLTATEWLAPIAASSHFAFHEPLNRFVLSFGIVLLTLLIALVSRVLVRRQLLRDGERWVSPMRRAAQTIAMFTLAASAYFILWPTLYAPEAYIESLPIIASLPSLENTDEHSQSVVVGSLEIQRSGSRSMCALSIREPGVSPDTVSRVMSGNDAGPEHDFHTCAPLTIRLDDKHHYWIMVARDESAAYRIQPTAKADLLRPIAVRDSLRPPTVTLHFAIVGAIVSLAILRKPAARPALPGDPEQCRDAVVRPDRSIEVDGQTVWTAPNELAPGSNIIVVLASPTDAYRSDVKPIIERIELGTISERIFAAQISAPAFALAVVVIAATPVLTALAL
ncbi:MAG: hypothetical protein U0165_11800 [Polyangiaceae bacterium]